MPVWTSPNRFPTSESPDIPVLSSDAGIHSLPGKSRLVECWQLLQLAAGLDFAVAASAAFHRAIPRGPLAFARQMTGNRRPRVS